jgi:hypothetical protein
MKSIRKPAALFLLTAGLCAGSALAQPPGDKLGQESFTLTPNPAFTVVDVQMEDDPNPDPKKVWKVVTGSVLNASKLSWNVDARCGTRLKSLSVKDAAGGIHDLKDFLTPSTKSLQKPLVNLPTFSVQFIQQLCLDIANGTFVTAQNGGKTKEELEKLQDDFENSFEATTPVTGAIFLSGRCVSANDSTTKSVTDQKRPAATKIRCIR